MRKLGHSELLPDENLSKSVTHTCYNIKMEYEIDYIPVGSEKKGGDAIALRYGDFSNPSTQRVVVIDGGTKESGRVLVEHIRKYYETGRVDLVVASHLHNDHISGLSEVFENMDVKKFAVHCPWDYTKSIQKMTITSTSQERLATKMERSLSALSSMVDLASDCGVEIIQPFAGDEILDNLYALGPTKQYYEEQLANFGITPDAKEDSRIKPFIKSAGEAVNWVKETPHLETLSDDYPDTSPENNSSLVLLLVIDGEKFLFTGDAGKDALSRAIDFSESEGIPLLNVDFLDVPHHGSKRNLGPTILNQLQPRHAFISCPQKGDPKHPSRKVINALIRRKCDPCSTRNGETICHRSPNVPAREGWGFAQPESFYDEVEE